MSIANTGSNFRRVGAGKDRKDPCLLAGGGYCPPDCRAICPVLRITKPKDKADEVTAVECPRRGLESAGRHFDNYDPSFIS